MIRVVLEVDNFNQWFSSLYVLFNGVYRSVRFKIDTGCNALVLSHFKDIGRNVPVCGADAVCHSTRQTNDLLGTEVLRQFTDISFKLSDKKYLELMK